MAVNPCKICPPSTNKKIFIVQCFLTREFIREDIFMTPKTTLFLSALWACHIYGLEPPCRHPDHDPQYSIESEEFKMGQTLLQYLEDNASRAAIVARVGSDTSKERFRSPIRQKYTHAGIVWKHSRSGRWQFKHILNTCAGREGRVYTQGLAQFFDDTPYMFDFYVLIPSQSLQEKIAFIVETHIHSFVQNRRYSQISNPFNTLYQNSNAWVLSVVASAQSGSIDLPTLQSYYRDQGFWSSQVHIGRMRAFFIPFIYKNVTLKDHSDKEHSRRWFNFVSAASLFDYLENTDDIIDRREICPPEGCNIPVTHP